MSANQSDIFRSTFEGLENGLRVKHIATFKLESCESGALPAGGLDEPRFARFNYIPICSGGKVRGIVNRKQPPIHEVPLDAGLLVAADMPLLTFIPLMGMEPHFRMVLDDDRIDGIVTRSDLLKLPVRVLAFGLVTHLEMSMAAAIRRGFANDDQWLIHLEEERQSELRQKEEAARAENLDLTLLDETEFGEKAKIIRKMMGLGTDFKSEMHQLKGVRNDVAHAKNYADSQAKMTKFIHLLGRARHWIEFLSSESPKESATV